MNQQNQPELPSKIYSEAVVRSKTGQSLLDFTHLITSKSVSQFYASERQLEKAAQQLHRAGFEILHIGKMSITIAAAPEVYERSLLTTLEAVERPVIKGLARLDTATFINSVDAKPFGEIDVSHTVFKVLLIGIRNRRAKAKTSLFKLSKT